MTEGDRERGEDVTDGMRDWIPSFDGMTGHEGVLFWFPDFDAMTEREVVLFWFPAFAS
jgi:hypothetical protein